MRFTRAWVVLAALLALAAPTHALDVTLDLGKYTGSYVIMQEGTWAPVPSGGGQVVPLGDLAPGWYRIRIGNGFNVGSIRFHVDDASITSVDPPAAATAEPDPALGFGWFLIVQTRAVAIDPCAYLGHFKLSTGHDSAGGGLLVLDLPPGIATEALNDLDTSDGQRAVFEFRLGTCDGCASCDGCVVEVVDTEAAHPDPVNHSTLQLANARLEVRSATAFTLSSAVPVEAAGAGAYRATIVPGSWLWGIVPASTPALFSAFSASAQAMQVTPLGGAASNPATVTVAGESFEVEMLGALSCDPDTTAPTITSLSASPDTIWEPNGRMVAVTVTAVVSDDSGDPVTVAITSVTGDDGAGDDDMAVTAGSTTCAVRAERSGSGAGRTYTITVSATDSSGNTATRTTTVAVPHDQSPPPGSSSARRRR